MKGSHAVGVPRSSLVEEMASGALGDQRLDARRDRLMAVLEAHPDTAFPEACADDAEVEALYRFLRNRRVSLGTLLEPHVVATQARCTAVGEVLVIHDTTDMVFAGEAARSGLAALGKGRQGFWVHTALAVSADGLRAPLGVLSLVPFVRKMQAPGTRKDERARFEDPEKESRCWRDGVAAVRTRCGAASHAIHVMDRGADSYELFAAMIAQGDRFVVRLTHDRRVVTDDGPGTLDDVTARTAVRCEQQVTIAPRRTGNRPLQARKKHPARDGRVATLQYAVQPLALQRPQGRQYAQLPLALAVHVIAVREIAAPPGEEPVEWRLVTTDPVDTVDQVLRIVEWYRTRWMIEEFFKALKTGCAYEKRQLESLATLVVALALLVPIAWQLLALRHLARLAPDGVATTVLSRRQLHVLHAAPAGARLGPMPTLRDALRAIARLGGHLTHNGDPGWLVLGRGMQKLLWMETGWAAAEGTRRM
jgi:transposase-like protein/DDE family transposase